jgi:hypothetical protein
MPETQVKKQRANLCAAHPYYKAVRRPVADCAVCRAAWRERHPQESLTRRNESILTWLRKASRKVRRQFVSTFNGRST